MIYREQFSYEVNVEGQAAILMHSSSSSIHDKRQPFYLSLAIAILCVLLVGCNVSIAQDGTSAGTMNSTTTSGAIGSGAEGVKVFVEPDAGYHVITDALNGATKSIWLEMYLLTEKHVIQGLEEAAHRGVDVRVMLEGHPYGGGNISPTQTLDRLNAAGVKAKTTNPSFALTHEKGMVVDGQTAYIMTANLTAAALGSSKSTTNREYGIIDTNREDVQAVINIFNADWNRSTAQFNAPNLVVSPVNSRNAFTSLIKNAHNMLLIEAEEMQDDEIEQAIVDAAKRGVHVQVILPAPSGSSKDSNSQGIQTIQQGGAQVKEDKHLYMHAKIIVADGQKAFVGSENISTASLERNRELGLIVSDQNVLTTLQQTFQQDWSDSQNAA
jgi:phosphatidylserine/phosphatidylglycerophosphate/cardiolipin synthase-like enzyme